MNENLPGTVDPSQQIAEGVSNPTPVLSLPIDDATLLAAINTKAAADTKFYNDVLKLDKRRVMNEDFWKGNQLDESKMDKWQVPYKDNILYQNLETRIAIAAGRMPDLIATPSEDTTESAEEAKQFEKILEIKVKNEVSKRLIKSGLRHQALKFTAAIKIRWDKNKGENGDFIFELVRPERISYDHTSTIPEDGFTADNMDTIIETIEEPIGVILAKFPAKKAEFLQAVGVKEKDLATATVSKVKYREVWFTWYGQDGEQLEGVAWIYKDIVLDKMRNPYFDWEGYHKVSDTEVDSKTDLPKVDTVYRNYFERPRKPYIIFSYQNMGNSPIDDTTPFEQGIPIQRIINKRGRQITEIADRAIPKLAFAGNFITKEEARRVTNDPDEHIWLENADNVAQAVQGIPAAPPNPILYQDLIGNRNRLDGLFATHGTTRGESVPQESGIAKQITREGDLTISDDIVTVVVERVVYEMANWATQMMKLLYDEPHFVKSVGKDGELIHAEITRDKISDGLMVDVKANSVDKAQRRADAMNLMGRKAIDPLTLMEDLDVPNPKERTKRLLRFLQGEQDGYARYMEEVSLIDKNKAEAEGATSPIASTDPATPADPTSGGEPPIPEAPVEAPAAPEPQGGAQATAIDAQADIDTLIAGGQVAPKPVGEEYLQVFIDFTESEEFLSIPDEAKANIGSYIQQLKAAANDFSDPSVVAPGMVA